MSRDISQNNSVKGHTVENKAMNKSHSFENCTIHGLTINIFPDATDESPSITFSGSSSGNISSRNTQINQLPNDVNTIMKVLRLCKAEGIDIPFLLPESVKLPAIERKEADSE